MSAAGRRGKRSANWGSSSSVLGVLTGAIGVLTRPPNSSHSSAVFVRKMSRSSRWSSRLPRAWSAYLEPGQRSKRSARSTPSQKFLQKACSDAMKSTWR